MNLKEAQAAIEKEIAALKFGDPSELYDPIHYIMQLGGKRLRPLLCLLTYNLFKKDWPKILKPAIGLEVFHNFTLMHDDIMDNAPLRRGKQTIHEKWNSSVGILSGDVMLVKSYELLSLVKDQVLGKVLQSFSKCATLVCEGQQIDMNFEGERAVTEEAYLAMIEKKTAALIGYSMELGGLLAGQNENMIRNLLGYGESIGMAFQLTDDLLDVYGNEKFGKQKGGDIISNKKTYLLIKALQLASESDQKTLGYWLDVNEFSNEQKINEVKFIYDKLNIKELAETKAREYFNKANDFLKNVVAGKQELELLNSFTENLKNRER